MQPIRVQTALNWLGGLALLAVLYFFRQLLGSIFLPFILGLLLAGVIEPMVNMLQSKTRIPRGGAVAVILALLVVLTAYMLFMMVANVATQLWSLREHIPAYGETLAVTIPNLIDEVNELYLNIGLPEYIVTTLNTDMTEFLQRAETTIQAFLKEVIDRSLASISGLPHLIATVIVSIISAFFFARDKSLFTDALRHLTPKKWRGNVDLAWKRIETDLVGYLKGQFALLALIFVLSAIGLILLGSSYWMLTSIVLSILDLIPIVGPGLILFPWAAWAIFQGQHGIAIGLISLFLVIISARQLLEPKVLGDSAGVHPLLMLLAIYGGLMALGVMGIFIGPICVIILKTLWSFRRTEETETP